jgi:hypothetical protein
MPGHYSWSWPLALVSTNAVSGGDLKEAAITNATAASVTATARAISRDDIRTRRAMGSEKFGLFRIRLRVRIEAQ